MSSETGNHAHASIPVCTPASYTGFEVGCPQKSDENERMRMIALEV
jgi:hypothetical protein